MRQGIHPNYHEITVQFTDGSSFKTRSCWGKPGETMQLDVDVKTHPAWVGGVHFKKTGQVEKFNAKFGGINFGGSSKKEEKKEDKKN